MAVQYEIYYSAQALEEIDKHLSFLRITWSDETAHLFLDLLAGLEKRLLSFPFIYPESLEFPGVRKATIHVHISVLYIVTDASIEIASVVDNRTEP